MECRAKGDKMSVTAKVNVSLEITVPSSWSEQTRMDQIKRQAIEDAKGILNRMCSEHSTKISDLKFISVTVTGV